MLKPNPNPFSSPSRSHYTTKCSKTIMNPFSKTKWTSSPQSPFSAKLARSDWRTNFTYSKRIPFLLTQIYIRKDNRSLSSTSSSPEPSRSPKSSSLINAKRISGFPFPSVFLESFSEKRNILKSYLAVAKRQLAKEKSKYLSYKYQILYLYSICPIK